MHHPCLSKTWLWRRFASARSSLPCTASLPNCVYGQDLDPHSPVWRARDLQIDCQRRLIITQTRYPWLTEGKTRLCSWWWICWRAKAIKWFSTELRSLSKCACQTEAKQPGIKMEFYRQLAARSRQRNSLCGNSHNNSLACAWMIK